MPNNKIIKFPDKEKEERDKLFARLEEIKEHNRCYRNKDEDMFAIFRTLDGAEQVKAILKFQEVFDLPIVDRTVKPLTVVEHIFGPTRQYRFSHVVTRGHEPFQRDYFLYVEVSE